MGTIRTVVVDYDGTLTLGGPPGREVLDAIGATREQGVRVVLATGRTLHGLRHQFADVERHFDAIVAENGAVLEHQGRAMLLAPAVDRVLGSALQARGIPIERGDVILASKAAHASTVLEVLTEHGLDDQLVFNRSELMVVPAGATKATGVEAALGELGLSVHNAVAIGDAENDSTMLHACELGVATANAVESLQRAADLVLDEANGQGVASLLRGPLVVGDQHISSPRWQVLLGHDIHGEPVLVPASPSNILIQGPSGAGKSHLAGLIAEQLIQLHYSVLVLDPEGDHAQLACLPGVFLTGGPTPILPAEQIVALLRHRSGSVVVDLSGRSEDEAADLYRVLPPLLEVSRAASGLPHWIVLDEAHQQLHRGSPVTDFVSPADRGNIVVTYLPEELAPAVRASFDVEVTVAAGAHGLAVHIFDQPSLSATVARRWTRHARHWHKYALESLPRERGFWFRGKRDEATGAVATSLAELHHELRRCSRASICHHAGGRDISRWIGDVFGDRELAARIAEAEVDAVAGGGPAGVERARHAMLDALEEQLLGRGTDVAPSP